MAGKLSAKQKELDILEAKIIENKKARVELAEEGRALRDEYMRVEDEREELLKEELTPPADDTDETKQDDAEEETN